LHEILHHLPPGSFVLDLGSRFGSFPAEATAAHVVRLDLDSPHLPNGVAGDARCLPFRDHAFQAIIANHSLEHVEGLEAALREIGRVLAPDGALYIAVPDSSTLCDKLYRWLAQGGGHVNAISDPDLFSRQITVATGLAVVARRTLHTSYSYLNAENVQTPSRKMLLLGGGRPWLLRAASRWMRRLDRAFGWRTTVYGWAFYAGRINEPVSLEARSNVCIRCGAGHASAVLQPIVDAAQRYRCPLCATENSYLPD
jgi:SAM-dependent methyltransferase